MESLVKDIAPLMKKMMRFGKYFGGLYPVLKAIDHRKTIEPQFARLSLDIVAGSLCGCFAGFFFPITLPYFAVKYCMLPDIYDNVVDPIEQKEQEKKKLERYATLVKLADNDINGKA